MLKSLGQIWRHRTLAEILVGRELKARYRGTLLGFLWSFANPLLTMSIYVLVFRVYMRIDVQNYPAFVLSGLLPWLSFSASVTDGMNALISNGGIIKKVYLPTEVFPFVAVTSNLVHFLLSVPVLLVIMAISHLYVSPHLLLLPVVLALQFIFTYAVALILASMAVQFRDLLHVVPNLLLIWFYLTPVFYASSMVPEKYRLLVSLNPMSFLIESYRDIFFAHRMPSVSHLGAFAGVSLAFLAVGMWFFQSRRELYPELV
jgi:lipopolysaccharide transport system permease protein